MTEKAWIKDRYYIVATSSFIDPVRLIQKDDDLFGVFDRFGDIHQVGKNEQGLYYRGTRFLSSFELRINGSRPLLLSSTIDDDNLCMTVDLTNPDIYARGRLLVGSDTVHILRSRLLLKDRCLEQIRFKNFGTHTVDIVVELKADADYKDIFEVRGVKRKKRGRAVPPEYLKDGVRLGYRGLDGVTRTTTVSFSKAPDSFKGKTFFFNLTIEPGAVKNLFITVLCSIEEPASKGTTFSGAVSTARRRLSIKKRGTPAIYTSNEQFNESIKRSTADINMMLTRTTHGLYPYGGIPWFCTPFGRDAIITSLETLWIRPELAKGVLSYLAAHQAEKRDPRRAAEPGKILHEMRQGEMAALGEVPFGLYYGSVDATPLFVLLAGRYWRRTDDRAFIRRLWPKIERALGWIDEYGDVDGDGFVEYAPDERGLRNQGWKDSHDSVFYRDGTLCEGPVALCEVQGYVYAAKKEAATLAELVGRRELCKRLLKEAETLKERFNRTFWDPELGTYVLALDGRKRPCRVAASNAGHTLFTGIAEYEKALKTADILMSPKLFTGWGIRTLASDEVRYNPMSYHNGSVWPHDNALIAAGFSAYGLKEHFNRVFGALFDASIYMELQRLPELFCGFHRRAGEPPTLYPVACTPQTWASGALLMMLKAALGMEFEADRRRILFRQPSLPAFLRQVNITGLMVAPGKSVDLTIRRYGEDVTVEALRKPADVSILIIK